MSEPNPGIQGVVKVLEVEGRVVTFLIDLAEHANYFIPGESYSIDAIRFYPVNPEAPKYKK